MTKVKICGITNIGDARECLVAGADAIGFQVDLNGAKCPVGAATTSAIIAQLPPFVGTVAVTSLTDPKQLAHLARNTGANTLQLHAQVTPDDIRVVKALMFYLKIVAVVHVDEHALQRAQLLADDVDALLLDTASGGALGGTGKTHDWNISRQIVEAVSKPVILAGGLTPENVVEAISTVRPYAVDVRSGVSNSDGTKDLAKVRKFIERAKGV